MEKMRRQFKILIILAMAFGIMPSAMAQTSDPEKKELNPIEKIEEESGGNITISIPDDILRDLLKIPTQQTGPSRPALRPGINKMNGYRIQVFGDGRNQVSLERRAKARGSAIVAKFPRYRGQVYSYSSSPNWYTRVGNFQTSGEASSALAELKRAFPEFANEMRVVKSQIIVIK